MNAIKILNRGGFGRVEELALSDGNIVARKIFDPTPEVIAATDVDKLKKRFKREVKVQSSLTPDFFIPVLSFNLDSENPWFTMPLCSRNYWTQIEEDRKNQRYSHEPLTDILNALEELHSLGFTHRDLKPQNVLLHEGKWKLSDFGLVMASIGDTTRVTSRYSAWGTEGYCAPEQTQDFHGVTASADIYSFGCILHDVFADTPRIPYQRHTCDGPVGLIIEKCTEVNPHKRFKTISSVRSTLLSTLADLSAKPSPEATEWVDELSDVLNWESGQLREFSRYLQASDVNELRPVCEVLDEERLRRLFNLDADVWESIALRYCDWAFKSGFNFEYCDVVVGRLECIFELGSLDCKAAAALSAAELGRSHNRWYVMKRLFEMCSHSLDSRVARRIAIEIDIEGLAKRNFLRCAEGLGRTVKEFHPLIARVLQG